MKQAWRSFQEGLRDQHQGPFYASKQDFELFDAFVRQYSPEERVPMLLDAYDRYRSLSTCGHPQDADPFEVSCYSILISTILGSGIQPSQIESTEILRKSYHRCGHGSDVEPPLTFAEKAFRNQPYSKALFDSARAYLETLRSTRSTQAANVKRKLNWVLWFDPRRFEKSCHTRRIQQAIHSMDAESAFHWQWLLRNTSAGLRSAPGKQWLKEGRRRLSEIGEEQFLSAIESWFTFPCDEDVKLSAPGSAMLRLLIWYGALADTDRSLPVLLRMAYVSWNKRAPAGKAMSALAWVLRTRGGMKFPSEARLICARWASHSAEVKRLEAAYFPEQADIRKRAELESRQQWNVKLDAQMEATLQAFREQHPRIFGPDSPIAASLAGGRERAEATFDERNLARDRS